MAKNMTDPSQGSFVEHLAWPPGAWATLAPGIGNSFESPKKLRERLPTCLGFQLQCLSLARRRSNSRFTRIELEDERKRKSTLGHGQRLGRLGGGGGSDGRPRGRMWAVLEWVERGSVWSDGAGGGAAAPLCSGGLAVVAGAGRDDQTRSFEVYCWVSLGWRNKHSSLGSIDGPLEIYNIMTWVTG